MRIGRLDIVEGKRFDELEAGFGWDFEFLFFHNLQLLGNGESQIFPGFFDGFPVCMNTWEGRHKAMKTISIFTDYCPICKDFCLHKLSISWVGGVFAWG